MTHRTFSIGSAVFAFLLAFAAGAPFALAADGSSIRSDSEDTFARLLLNSKNAMKKAEMRAKDLDGGAPKFQIVSETNPIVAEGDADLAREEVQTAAKVWFELADGVKVDPREHEWRAKEKFYVYVEATAPVFVYLFHEQPAKDGAPAQSIQVYPNKRYPNSAKAIQAGTPTRLPVKFEMDDNAEDEIMSMVVVRADWEPIQNDLTKPAAASVDKDDNGAPIVTAQIDKPESASGTLKCLNLRASSKKNLAADDVKRQVSGIDSAEAKKLADVVNKAGASAKFIIAAPEVEESDEVKDVCFYMFASQKVGHWQLTIKKDKK